MKGALPATVANIVPVAPLKPALASINDSCKYVGGVSRATFYKDFLPLLETVRFNGRHFVVVDSLDRLIASRKQGKAA
jgi:hypothetical protein